MAAAPDISVVTPTRNRLALLLRTMDSVAAQSFANWEHIIVDDGSDDGTGEAVTERAVADPRIRFIKRSGALAGANVCRNIGVREARSDLIVLLDSDDLLRPHCLAGRREAMARNLDLDFAVFRAGVFNQVPGDMGRLFHDQSPGDDLFRFVAQESPWQTTGPVWRRAYLQKIGGFDETLLSLQDLELHVRALVEGGRYLRFTEVDHDIRWELDTERTSMRHYHDPQFAERIDLVRAKMDAMLRQAGLISWSRSRALTGVTFGAAESLARMGFLGKALAVWRLGSVGQREGLPIRAMGAAMLLATRLGGGRLVNKWKGWVRFRQEPDLMRAGK